MDKNKLVCTCSNCGWREQIPDDLIKTWYQHQLACMPKHYSEEEKELRRARMVKARKILKLNREKRKEAKQ